MDSSVKDILKIYEAALELSFEGSENDHGRLLPATMLQMLSEQLSAAGGNFSIYNAQDDVLDVRARYPHKASGLDFRAFKEHMAQIGSDGSLGLRLKSSSYRCLDNKTPILVRRSDLSSPDRMTLDIQALEPREDLSAAAVPFFAHDECIGVLHMDSNNHRVKQFSREDLTKLEILAPLLGPVVFNGLLTEAVGNINRLILTSNDQGRGTIIEGVCGELSKVLFMPWVGLYQRHPNRKLFELKGQNKPFPGTLPQSFALGQLTIESPHTGSDAPTVFITLAGETGDVHPDLIQKSSFSLGLRDQENQVSGFLLLVDPQPRELSPAFRRMGQFVAGLTNLSLNALLQFEARGGDNYENAAHTFTRNLARINNAKHRIDRHLGTLNRIAATDKEGAITDIRYELNRLKPPMGALESNIAESRDTLMSLLNDPLYAQYRGQMAQISRMPREVHLISAAQRRHRTYQSQSEPSPLDLRTEIEDMLNNNTEEMSRKGVRWERDFDRMPRDMLIEPMNFRAVMGNIIDNAVKYSRAKSTIRVEVATGDSEVVIRVTNTGPYIDIRGTEGSDIFQRGIRGESVDPSEYKGMGVGLWEADQLSRIWGGRPLRLIHSELLGTGDRWASICFELRVPYDRASPFRSQ